MKPETTFILTLSCADQPGIVFAVSGFLVRQHCNILDSQQHCDPLTERFFMRVSFEALAPPLPLRALSDAFGPGSAISLP